MDEEGFTFGEAVKEAMRQEKEFEKKADGGSIGIEVFFGPKRKNFRGGGTYQGVGGYGRGRSKSTTAKAPPSMGFGNPPPGSKGGGGGGDGPKTQIKKPIFKSDIAPQFQGLVKPAAGVKFDFLKKQKFYNQPFKLEGVTPNELMGAEIEGGINDLRNLMGGEMTVGNVLENMAGGSYGNVMPSTQNKIQEQILGQVDFGDAFPKNYSFGNITPTIEGGRIDIDETKLDDDAMAAKKFLDLKDGGRVGMVSGGFLKSLSKGIGSLFGKGDDAVDLAKQEEIFRTGPITKEFLETVDSKVINPFVRSRDTKGVGSYGLYESFDDMPAVLKAAELISRIRKKGGGIDYEAAEIFLGKKLKGDETINELIDIMLTEKKADGGRVGLFMGGPALEGQALAIYNSMNAYGFSDQEIANALQEQGLYDPNASGGSTPAPDTGIIGAQLNQGGDDKPMIRPFREDPRVGSAFEAYQRNQQLQSMDIKDPFADEISLQGAYYGDMPNVDLSTGKQTLGGAIKSGVSKVLNFPLVKGMSLMTPVGVGKEILKGLGSLFPVNQRRITENIAGNMGIAVDVIGRIVNTGNYQDPENVMAGYNLNKLTDKSFDKRIDTISKTLSNKYGLGVNEIQGILEGTLSDEQLADINLRAIMPGTNKTTNLIKQLRSINIAKDRNKFIQDIAKKEAERQKAEKERKAAFKQAARDRETYRDLEDRITKGEGRGDNKGPSTGPTAAGAGMGVGGGYASDYGFLKDGGLATMFTRRR